MPQNNIYEISILGRITWNLHSLNNEGNVGNVTEPRSVRIIAHSTGLPVSTDGISGEMLKHIHATKLWELTKKENLCSECKKMGPERANKNSEVTGKKSVEAAIEHAIKSCCICDIHGFLIEKPTCARSSLVEFGWALGIPISSGEFIRDIHIHARHDKGEKGKNSEDEKSSQMIYHRPTRSGEYAVISVFQPWRIGLNDATMEPTKGVDKEERYKTTLKAYQAMFMRTEGAMTSTRLPHTTSFSGLIVVSRSNFPVPVISPLKENYKEEIKNITKSIGNMQAIEFNSIHDFVEKLNTIMDDKVL